MATRGAEEACKKMARELRLSVIDLWTGSRKGRYVCMMCDPGVRRKLMRARRWLMSCDRPSLTSGLVCSGEACVYDKWRLVGGGS